MRWIAIIILGLSCAVLWLLPDREPEPDRRILFIGNSFTFGGNIPEQVRRIALTADTPTHYEVSMHVRGGTTLLEHVEETDAAAAIRAGDWDVVVLQDASSMAFSAPWRAQMTEAATHLAEIAAAQGASVLYYAHWPPSTLSHVPVAATYMIETTYQRLADDTGGAVAPAGRLWLAAREAGYSGLYAEDGHHSSYAGAYVAALALTAALGDVDPATAEWAPTGVDIDAAAVFAQLSDIAELGR